MNKILLPVLIMFATTSFAYITHGHSVIGNRASLNGILETHRVDEGFEIPQLTGGGAARGYGVVLSATNDSFGAFNLVANGITITSLYPQEEDVWIQWNDDGYRGLSTQTIYSAGSLFIDFWNPASAFGVDLKDFLTIRQTFIAGGRVYGADDSTVIHFDDGIAIPGSTNGVFFGFQDPTGIGAVEILTISGIDPGDDLPHVFSPIIDNLTFGVVPEPSTVWLTLLGVGTLAFRMRRK